MAEVSHHSANTTLQSRETRNLLDIVDNLRSHGINRYIDLPEIIVCVANNLLAKARCSKRFRGFATELILRRGPDAPIKISIVPSSQGSNRSETDMEKLHNFQRSVTRENLQLGDIIESAKDAMGIDDSIKVFSSDILRLELSGPEQPHLTLVDLPGLFEAGSRSQSDADSETVKSLVLSYMKNPRSIILAVVSAKNDFNNQSITRYSRQIDPKGERTLGLITKPDTLDEGSDSERFYFELAQNKDVRFRLGWHVLRNRDYSSRNSSTGERDKAEAMFFNSGIWKALPPNQVAVHTLRPRLSKILKDHIVAQLPDVLAQIKSDALGASRGTVQEQRRYLLQASHAFSTLVRASIDGQYSAPFFGDASTTEGYQKRLRAVLQNTLTDFAAEMRKNGHTYTIIDVGPAKLPGHISRTDYVAKVTKLLKRSRGRELPGTFDPLIVGQLFNEQRKPWARLVDQHLEIVLHAVYFLAHTALAHVCDQSTLAGLSKRFILIRLERLAAELRTKVTELLKPHDTGHPITYNHYLTENVQKAQSKRQAREIKSSLERILGGDYTAVGVVDVRINVNTLINTIVSKTEADMNNYASSTATDFMEAYYKVAMKKIIDDFSVLAVEARLIQELPTLFSPADIIDIDDATVVALASESEESSTERTLCEEKLKVMEDGLRALQSAQEYSSGPKEPDQIFMKDLEWENHISEPTEEHEQNGPVECQPGLTITESEELPPAEDDWTSPIQVARPGDGWDLLTSTSKKDPKKKKR
ncbi:hypothetical protein N0V90_013207 [Kalmusia sp. IMI 367209]|nr:hypothetical protein N0V90_013207 [Kalmusia sp. IMI 367209]